MSRPLAWSYYSTARWQDCFFTNRPRFGGRKKKGFALAETYIADGETTATKKRAHTKHAGQLPWLSGIYP